MTEQELYLVAMWIGMVVAFFAAALALGEDD